MAVLQNIRSRGGIIVSIVIGLAMVAFIVGDALSSSASFTSSSRNQVGEIAGEEVSIQDFENQVKENEDLMKQNSRTGSLNEEQQNSIRENTWQRLVLGKIMEKEYEALGINVSSEELFDYMLGDNMSPTIAQMFGNADPAQIREYVKTINNLPAYDPQKIFWLNIEDETRTSRKMAKYSALVSKALYATDAEVSLAIDNNTRKADISYIVKPYSSIADSTINVSNDEIKAYYKKHAPLFQQGESRNIQYVSFSITPSPKDYSETEAWVKKLISEFESTENANEYVDQLSIKKHDGYYYKKEDIKNQELAEYLFAGNSGVFGPYLENDSYFITRAIDTKMMPDSVRARHILIANTGAGYAEAKAKADSLANLIRKGADFESIAKSYSNDENSAVNGGDLGWFDSRSMIKPFSDAAFSANINEIKVVETNYGFHILQVRERTPLVKKVQMATVEKDVVPSSTTINDIFGKAREFATDIKTVEDFQNKVQEMNLNARRKMVNKNDRMIDNIANSRELIRQIYMTEDKGKVIITKEGNSLFDTGHEYIVAVLTDINEEGTAPINNVASLIKNELIREKKAEIITKEMQTAASNSESLLSLAQKMGVEVKNATDVTYNSFQIPGSGMEPKVIAAASLAEIGSISAPVAGNSGVFAFTVDNAEDIEVSEDLTKQAKLGLTQSYLYRSNLAIQALMKNGEVKDFRYKFY